MTALIAIVGATGTGKSELSVELASRAGELGRTVEVVGADAMQLYRGMDIGTAKLSVEERRGVPHHLIDVLEPSEEASVSAYQRDARAVVGDILERGGVPMLVGGSGLYVSSVLFDFEFPGTDPAVRSRLERELAASGPGMLHRRLRELDPDAARAIGPHNARRIVRALEVIELTGEPFGAGLPSDDTLWHTPTVILSLELAREALTARLDERVRRMWRDGLVDEVRALDRRGLGPTAERAIGYAQAREQLAGELTEEEAIERTAALTRKYARRQVGWFRRYRNAHRLDAADPQLVERAWSLVAPCLGGSGAHR